MKICIVEGCGKITFKKYRYCPKHRDRLSRNGSIELGKKVFGLDERSIRRYIRSVYSNQVAKSRIRGHEKPEYSQQELYEWAIKQPNFMNLYRTWIDSGYSRNLMPSFDRLDNRKGYSFSNIRLVTLKENVTANILEWKEKYGSGTPHLKKIVCMSNGVEIVKEFPSLTEASQAMGVKHQSIQSAIKTKRKCKGYNWFYKPNAGRQG